STSFSYRRVAYGGVNGVYYSSSIGQRTGGDGVMLLEMKEEDKTVGQALHTISRGIHEKGHTLTKKRNPDGNEDSFQILHNLNEVARWLVHEVGKSMLTSIYLVGMMGSVLLRMQGTDGAMVPAGEPPSDM
ncbi:putative myeloid leukemia factor, partial [Tanacetum coccineum]